MTFITLFSFLLISIYCLNLEILTIIGISDCKLPLCHPTSCHNLFISVNEFKSVTQHTLAVTNYFQTTLLAVHEFKIGTTVGSEHQSVNVI